MHEGPCIGGPRDGQWFASDHSWFEAYQIDREPIPASVISKDIPVSVAIKTTIYRAISVCGQTLWVSENWPDDPAVLIEQLAYGYTTKSQGIQEPRQRTSPCTLSSSC